MDDGGFPNGVRISRRHHENGAKNMGWVCASPLNESSKACFSGSKCPEICEQASEQKGHMWSSPFGDCCVRSRERPRKHAFYVRCFRHSGIVVRHLFYKRKMLCLRFLSFTLSVRSAICCLLPPLLASPAVCALYHPHFLPSALPARSAVYHPLYLPIPMSVLSHP